MIGFILIVMFGTNINFVAMQRFDTEEACNKAAIFVRSNHSFAKAECIKDGPK